MSKKTMLDEVKKVALIFLYMDIEETPFTPIVVQHPIFESAHNSIIRDGEPQIVNILEDKEAYQEVVDRTAHRIKEAKDVIGVYCVIRKSYKLTFLKYTRDYLSRSDFSELLADAWVLSENPNGDVNVSISELIKWFSKADKKALMTEEDYKVYDALPPNLTVYRGVAPGRNPNGLSWTCNHSTAEWFAKRYEKDGKSGYIQKANITKDAVLAYFNTRNEDEVVVNTNKIVIERE